MAEEKYTIPKDPAYQVEDIRKLQDSDPASATDTFNPLIQKVLESIANVNRRKAELAADGKVSAELLPTGEAGGVAGLGEDGKVPADQLPALGGHIAQVEPPDNTNLLWVDTSDGNILKFYDAETDAWKPVGAVWS